MIGNTDYCVLRRRTFDVKPLLSENCRCSQSRGYWESIRTGGMGGGDGPKTKADLIFEITVENLSPKVSCQ